MSILVNFLSKKSMFKPSFHKLILFGTNERKTNLVSGKTGIEVKLSAAHI